MRYKLLRAQMKSLSPPTAFTLKNSEVVIDGKTFFKNTYKRSGCSSILGGEYDRYANYLKTLLKPFIDSHVKCYVIFNGAMTAHIERRIEIHQRIIDRANSISPYDDETYCDPIFIKDTWKQVLDELDVTYYVIGEDSSQFMLQLAQHLNCPLITQNCEFALLYTSCISPKTLTFDPDSESIQCQIFHCEEVRKIYNLKHCLLPLFFTIVDEESSFFNRITEFIVCRSKNLMTAVLGWIRWQSKCIDITIMKIIETLSEEEGEEFMSNYNELKAFMRRRRMECWQNSKAILTGGNIFAIPYENLTKKATISGSWLIFDKDEEDAMLPTLDIVCFVYYFTIKADKVNITFIGRKGDKSCAWNVQRQYNKKKIATKEKMFGMFVDLHLRSLDLDLLLSVPKSCWMLILALVYACNRRLDLELAYCFLLSYVMLGPVSEKVGVIKRCNFMSQNRIIDKDEPDDECGLKLQDCETAVAELIDLFYVKDLKKNFDKGLLHRMAEFQHCLQHMNYMNLTFSNGNTMPLICPTIYHKTVNSTFVYNLYLEIKGKDDVMKYFKKRLNKSSVYKFYSHVVNIFHNCFDYVL